jgi:hypothetical protein
MNIDSNFDHQMSTNKSKCLYSNNSLQFLQRAVPLRIWLSKLIGGIRDVHYHLIDNHIGYIYWL